ncbi:sensor histidine kinase, PAS, PAS, PAS and PAS domain-containing [Geotalea daltonii FRC-32]|uniref:histidine kinase n=1 Tax=Geotalea daltonii (strain DSM 22248 / JCM 15807 / FRC-32) TaxID=316067 RepID=B9M9J0_GEODF|nr:PAS domain S-box protein [Geotalea daltonii]ACM20562.1 sensor histidine kinase, PAS, PAS, PAS and PAS domain-containing [Geotalea daltonii FRC-32]
MKCILCKSEQIQVLLIVSIYIIFSTLWIYTSDRLLFVNIDPQLRESLSFYKGEAFVLLSAALLYLLIIRYSKRLKEASLAGEERFRLIADSMPSFVWTAKPDGTVDYVNKIFKEFTGLETYDDSSCIHPEDRAATETIWREAMQTGNQYQIEHRFRRHDGIYRWYLCRAVPVHDPAGKIIRWYGTSTDIDDLKSAKERISRILDSTSDGFIAIDRDWRVTDFNRKAEELSGLKAEQLIGQTYWEIVPQAPGSRIENAYRSAMEENRSVHFEEYYLCYGKLLDVYVHPYVDGIAVFFHDLSDRERVAEALRSRTEELESLLRHAPIGFAFFDNQHRYLRVNKALCQINGLSEEQTLGKTIGEVLPVNARIVDPILVQVFDSGEAVETEISGETPKEPGITRHWLTGFFPVFASTKKPVAVGTYVVEITERKRAEEAMSRLAAIVQGAEDAVFSEDLNGIVQTWNKGAEKLYGYSADEIIGKHISIVVPPELAGELEEMTRKMKQGIQDHFETVRITKQGERIFVFLTMSPIRNATGRIVGVSKIVRDISERKRAEEDLKETVKALERTNRELQQFAYVASHDLQEPLRNVTRYMDLFARKYEGHIDEKADKYIRFAMEGANRIHALVNDLLAYSELGVAAGEFKPVSMLAIAEEAMDNLRQLIEESHAVIVLDAMPEVHGNKGQLVQLLQNLLCNAVKFGKSHVAPLIRISAERLADAWCFSVRDNGVGIDPLYFDKIFVIFQRLHARSEHPGTGIGLAICRKIVELHGGRIWVESRLDEGSTFYFTIPARGGTR